MNIPDFAPGELPPLDVARESFEDFDAELNDHLRRWFVFALPGVFMMAKIKELPDNEQAWHITCAIGPLPVLLGLLPFRLPWITFQRSKGSPRERIISYDRAMDLTQRRQHA